MSVFAKALGLAVTVLGFLAAPTQAGLKLYSGSLQFHAFGNTVIFTLSPPTSTGGAPLPTYTRSSFYAIPMGHFCNYQNLTHFVSKGTVYTGTRFISTAYPAPRSSQAMDCAATGLRRIGTGDRCGPGNRSGRSPNR